MPHLSFGSVRCALRNGDNILGGNGANAIAFAPLDFVAPAASIHVDSAGHGAIRRLSAKVLVRVDGQVLGVGARTLEDGARIDVEGCRLLYISTASPEAPAGAVGGVNASPPPTELALPRLDVAQLVEVRTGRSFPLSASDTMIGREPSCDVVLAGTGVSRLHATVKRTPAGYVLEDASANGTWVNGDKVPGTQLLRDGDRITVHDEELRFEASGGTSAPEAGVGAATRILAPVTAPRPSGSAASARPQVSAPGSSPLATLEVTRGALAGTSYRADRAVVALGRGEANDVRIVEESVSTSHATLLRKGDTWYVIDLQSSNGTYVDGYRVAGERELPPGCLLRLGTVELRFRPLCRPSTSGNATRHIAALFGRVSRLF